LIPDPLSVGHVLPKEFCTPALAEPKRGGWDRLGEVFNPTITCRLAKVLIIWLSVNTIQGVSDVAGSQSEIDFSV